MSGHGRARSPQLGPRIGAGSIEPAPASPNAGPLPQVVAFLARTITEGRDRVSVEQGHRYQLCAAVARLEVLAPVVAAHPIARLIELDPARGLLPVTAGLTTALVGTGGSVPPETGFWLLTPGVLGLVSAASTGGPVAYIEADYLGRDGRQTAAVWESGELVHGPYILNRHEPFPSQGGGPIGAALRHLGVSAIGRRDEFVVLGLGRHRTTEEWR